MSGTQKVYVIDPGIARSNAGRASSNKESAENPEYLQPSGKGGGSGTRQNGRQSGTSLILAYLAGPLSILATKRGRRSRFWAALSVISIALSAVVIWMWKGVSYWSTSSNPIGAVMLLMAVAAVVTGVSSWTRAVMLAGKHEGPRLRRSPDWMRSPVAAGIFGIISPGMGLFAASGFKRAAAALWMSALTLISLLVLLRSSWLWSFNDYAGVFAVEPDTLEYIFMIAGATAVLGGLAWVFQALNGARLAAGAKSRKSVSRSNWVAVALLLSVIAFSALSRPQMAAESFDGASAAANAEGMRIIPLYLSRAAVKLDPSHPEYSLRLIGIYESRGESAAADALRRKLVDSLEPSIPLLEDEGRVVRVAGGGERAAIPARPAFPAHAARAPATVAAEMMILDHGMNTVVP